MAAPRGQVFLATILRGFLLFLIWMILTGARTEGLALGIVAVPAAVWLSLRLMPSTVPVRYFSLGPLYLVFLWRSLLGGADVAWRAFDPRMPLDPGFVPIAVRLGGGARVALGAFVSLMPGTLAAGTRQGKMMVHVLDLKRPIREVIRRDEAMISAITGKPGSTE